MATNPGRVSTALHAELTEYTNLIRTIRTTRTLDITTHLLQHAAQQKGKEGDKVSDTWTPWPLIDCPVPEWSFEDEVQQLGEMVVQQYSKSAHAHVDGEARDDRDESGSDSDSGSDRQGLSPAAARLLVFHTGSVLTHILNLMADQRPSAPGSMQNRLSPMNWEDVISLLAVSGVVDPAIVARAERRLERIYGPSTTKALERLRSARSARARFSALATIQEDQLLAPPACPRPHRDDSEGCRLHESGDQSRAIIDKDTGMVTSNEHTC